MESPTEIYKDRSAALAFIGYLEALLGAALIVTTTLSSQIPGILAAVGLVWMGMGLAAKQNWSLKLQISFLWLMAAKNLIGLIASLATLSMASFKDEAGTYAPLILSGGALVTLIPYALARALSGKNFSQTCLKANPGPAWIESFPIPLLTLTILTFSLTAQFFLGAILKTESHFFGSVLEGVKSTLWQFSMAAFYALALSLTYKKQVSGWHLITILEFTRLGSYLATFAVLGKTYGFMDMTAATVSGSPLYGEPIQVLTTSVTYLMAFLIFSGYCRRYFT